MQIQLKRILAAVDFSDVTESVVRHGAELARVFGAELVLCHIVDRGSLISQIPPGGEGYLPPNLPQLQEDYARDQVHQLQARLGLPTLRLEVGHGAPYAEIIRIAKEGNFDLLLVGTHGRGAISHMLLGSCAERVVRHGPCPVLTIRSGSHEFVDD